MFIFQPPMQQGVDADVFSYILIVSMLDSAHHTFLHTGATFHSKHKHPWSCSWTVFRPTLSICSNYWCFFKPIHLLSHYLTHKHEADNKSIQSFVRSEKKVPATYRTCEQFTCPRQHKCQILWVMKPHISIILQKCCMFYRMLQSQPTSDGCL